MRDQHVYLNGISLEDAHPLILLQHIDESSPEISTKTGDRAGAPGQFVTASLATSREITITFAVRERLDFAKRAEAVSAAAAWAMGGGWLSLSSRPGLRLWVVPEELPSVGRLRDWTDDVMLVLAAYEWPFWSEASANTATLEGVVNEDSAFLSVPGTVDTRLEAVITPTDGELTSAEISVDGQTMTLSGLTVDEDVPLRIWWDEHHLLRIEAGGTGLLGKRTGDDLILKPGRHEVTVTVSTTCDVKLMARGCYL